MKNIAAILALAALALPAVAASPEDGLVGIHALRMGQAGNQVDMHLACWRQDGALRCMANSSMSSAPGAPPEEVDQHFNEVRPVADPAEARYALSYAIGQRQKDLPPGDMALAMAALRPVLASSPSVNHCWDLGDSAPGAMLACTLKGVPAGSPSLYLFGTLMARCGDGFCRYVITPMTRAD